MNKENCALKLDDEIILYYDARSKKHRITEYHNNPPSGGPELFHADGRTDGHEEANSRFSQLC